MLPGVGVFGTSLTARVIIPLLKDEGFSVKALWGRTPEEAEELAKEMSVPFYTSRIDEVLLHQDVDLVCINLPPPLTRQIAVKTLADSPNRCPGNSVHGEEEGRGEGLREESLQELGRAWLAQSPNCSKPSSASAARMFILTSVLNEHRTPRAADAIPLPCCFSYGPSLPT
uniref:Gfo/Idh/MocA-like oxidoreductase domain containing 1 n=1 Tax=Sus scrofa TaxID=9823 RepID=A0A8D1UGB8_PIG